MTNLKICLESFYWCEIGAKEVEGLSCEEITPLKPKLALLKLLKEKGGA